MSYPTAALARLRHERPYEAGAVAAVGVATALTAIVGPEAVVVGAGAAAAAALLFPRPRLTIATLTVVWFLAVVSAPLTIAPVAVADVAAPARSFVLALLGAQALRVLATRRLPLVSLFAPFVGFLLVVGASVAVADPVPRDALLVIPFAALIAAAVIVSWEQVGPAASPRPLLDGLAWGYAFIAIANLALVPFVAQSAFLVTVDGPRFRGAVENPNTLGLLGFAAMPVLVAAASVALRGSWARAAYSVAAAAAGAQVLLSFSRAGLASTVVGLAVIGFAMTYGRARLRTVLAVLTLGVTVLLAMSGLAGVVTERLRLDTLNEAGGRALAAPLAVAEIGERPWLGHGYGSEEAIFEGFGTIVGYTGQYTGNLVLDVLLEAGVLGLVGLLVALIGCVYRLRNAPWSSMSAQQRLVLASMAAIVAGGLANSQGESFLLRPGGPSVFAFWLALCSCSAIGLRYDRSKIAGPGQRSLVT